MVITYHLQAVDLILQSLRPLAFGPQRTMEPTGSEIRLSLNGLVRSLHLTMAVSWLPELILGMCTYLKMGAPAGRNILPLGAVFGEDLRCPATETELSLGIKIMRGTYTRL